MVSAIAPMHSPFAQPPQKKQKMSITQTYFLAHTARGKLAKEAARADHDLRLLVGHANLLDELMIDLANAEQEQENWFNRTVSGAKAAEEEQNPSKPAKHIQWADTVIEEPEEDWQVEDADSEDEDEEMEDEEPMTATTVALSKPSFNATTVTTRELTDEYDEDEDLEELMLTRTESHHPPELTSDSDDDSEDESMPPSPPSTTIEFTEKERQAISTTSFYNKTSPDHQLSEVEQSHFLEEGFYIPPREQPVMIPAY